MRWSGRTRLATALAGPAALVAAAVVTSCADGTTGTTSPPTSSPAALRLSPRGVVSLDVLDTLRLTATVRDAGGADVPGARVTWTSLNPNVLRVDSAGRARPGQEGLARVIATAGGAADTVVVVVRATAHLTVWPDTNVLVPGTGRTLGLQQWNNDAGAITKYAGAAWSSSNPAVARVDSAGGVVAVAPGVATITAVLPQGRAAGVVYVPASTAPRRFTSVVPASVGACALTAAGLAYCWGSDPSLVATSAYTDRCEFVNPPITGGGHLPGPATRITRRCSATPLPVERAPVLKSLVPGTSCGLTSDGTLSCWGYVPGDTTADGAAALSTTPAAVAGLPRLQSASGDCGLSLTGDAWCWGGISFFLGAARSGLAQVAAPPAGSWAFLAAGYATACGLTGEGRVACGGLGPSARLGGGAGNLGGRNFANAVTDERFTDVATSDALACARRADGRVFCWGAGYPVTLPSDVGGATAPTAVATPEPVATLAVYDGRACGVGASGAAYCWTGAQAPSLVQGQLQFRLLTPVYGGGACGIARDGLTYCWGASDPLALGAGQLVPPNGGALVRVAGQ